MKKGIGKLVKFRRLELSLLSAISFRLVQDFLFRLLDVLTLSPASVELILDSVVFLDFDLFLFLLLASNKVMPVSVLAAGVAGLFKSSFGISDGVTSAITTESSKSTLSGMGAFTSLLLAHFDLGCALSFGGYSSFK